MDGGIQTDRGGRRGDRGNGRQESNMAQRKQTDNYMYITISPSQHSTIKITHVMYIVGTCTLVTIYYTDVPVNVLLVKY